MNCKSLSCSIQFSNKFRLALRAHVERDSLAAEILTLSFAASLQIKIDGFAIDLIACLFYARAQTPHP